MSTDGVDDRRCSSVELEDPAADARLMKELGQVRGLLGTSDEPADVVFP
ncbi:hypothetical protein [Agromyces salentinus]|nr:hypothetical protein [Agromyces salentinus]